MSAARPRKTYLDALSRALPKLGAAELVLALGLVACSSGGSGERTALEDPDTHVSKEVAVPDPECVTNQDCADQLADLGSCQVAVCLPGVLTCGVQDVNPGTPCDDGDACEADSGREEGAPRDTLSGNEGAPGVDSETGALSCGLSAPPEDWSYPEGPFGTAVGEIFPDVSLEDCDSLRVDSSP